MIACFVEENHDNWDRYLHEFSFALRTAVNETTGKTPAELFLGRKIITPFRKLINVMDGVEYGGENIEKLFDEARQNMWKQTKTWEKYYNQKRRAVNIKVNDLVLKPSGDESKSRKSNKGTAGLEDLRLKCRNLGSNGTAERNDRKRSKICGKRSFQGSEHRDQKRQAPVLPQGLKRTVPSSISSRNHKYRRPNNPSQGPQSIAGPSHQIDTRQCKPPTEGSRQGASVQYDRAQETRTTLSEGNSAAEGRPVRSRQVTAVIPCSYYLRSRLNRRNTRGAKEHWDRQSTAEQPQEKKPQHGSLRQRSADMSA
ncbi:uncharacterized protein TNCV_1216541 [Trichonephila clavipes]|nr:uncharacterized protein TNCV_1216541 [Trichonephila clavipes]